MKKFKPTEEQDKVFFYVAKRPENILIKARAGAGKTSTIVTATKLIPKDKKIIFLAFNKHIQEELKTKLPEHVYCYTTYGLGNSAIKRKYGDLIEFDEFKVDKAIQKKVKSWKLDEEMDSEDISSYLNSIKKLVNLCRLTLTLKPDYIPNLAEKHDILLKRDKDLKRVVKILNMITVDRKTYDYTDMIYLPAIDNAIWMFPYDYVFFDENQDANRCQIKIIEKILKKDKLSGKYIGRLISVGDDFQNIYGFNGSGGSSYNWFKEFPNTKILSLTTSFRCSKNVIKKAQEIVPDIKALDNAPDGVVRKGSINESIDGDFILCRTTAPLIKLFFEFLVDGKKAVIKGRDIGLQLIELIGETRKLDDLITFWKAKISNYERDLRNEGILNPDEHSGYTALNDKVSTLLFLAERCVNVYDLKQKIKSIFTDDLNGIVLSTIHKVKGLEADRVFIIRPDLIPLPNAKSWQYMQEKNLCYVAITRAKLDLIYDYDWTDEEDDANQING